ncbi:M20 family metallo-hydrolase [Sphingobacterium bovistauri]|uniref:M20 family metallo-hydrolase n=1 Tax=Sphingobacterium bovistauri TaxID=2781959 RepID=A0ABS7Z402_9SPHI|nr:M20 family metallo-hydrolase [Sphingobacterium bovistauri]MCA5004287.1 M20 family metallo-hydrolase [Sphingobacterium bovistauri]
MNKNIDQLIQDSKSLLAQLIEIPSFSREEDQTADCISTFLIERGISNNQIGNNVIAYNKYFDESKPTILLNSHHDTVKPNSGYTKDPFKAIVEDEKLFGLGANDAGGCLVSLIATFLYYYEDENLAYNLCLIVSAEEEISGKEGIEEAYKHVVACDFAIVGEPTLLDLAVAEKGLMVLDCTALGESGHAAREEGVNAIYKAIEDINWFNSYKFPNESTFLGPVKMSVTVINAGSQHNVVPAECKYVVDVRTTEVYTNVEVLGIIQSHVKSDVVARSTRLNPSTIAVDHPIVQAGIALGKKMYGSPTMSDQALLPIPSIKVGPGDSARSHTADEFIYLKEIEDGISFYVQLLGKVL